MADAFHSSLMWQRIRARQLRREPLCRMCMEQGIIEPAVEDKKKLDLKAGNFYQASIYAWNAFREDKSINTVKYDTKKGFYAVAA